MSWLISDIENVAKAVAGGFKELGSDIGQLPSDVVSSVKNFFGDIGSAIYAAFSALGEFIYHAWEVLVDGLMSVGGWFYNALDRIAHFFEWLWDNIARLFAWLAQVIWNAFVTLFNWIVDAFRTIGNFIVQHVNQVIQGLDPSFYGLWCSFRNKLQAIVTANVTEVLVYKSIESAAEGKISLRGFGDWAWFAARILGAPIAGQLAAAVLNAVLPPCGTPTSSFVGQFTLPTLPTFTLPSAPSLVITPPSFFSPVPSLTSFTYVITYTTATSVGLPAQATSLGVSFTYSIAVPQYLSAATSMAVSFAYEFIAPPSFSWTNALGVSFTYSAASPLSVSWTNALSVSFSYSL